MAADTIIGAGLSPSPYREAMGRIEQLERDLEQLRWRSAHYIQPDCSGRLVGDPPYKYEPDCARLRRDLAAAREALQKVGEFAQGGVDLASTGNDRPPDRCQGVDARHGDRCSFVAGHIGPCLSLAGLKIVPLAAAPAEPQCSPTLTVCPRCHNRIADCDGLSAAPAEPKESSNG